jgi:hypothetical protein
MRTLGTILVAGLAGLFACSALAFDQPAIICAGRVSSFIGRMHFGGRFAGGSRILGSRGYSVQWASAIAGEGTAIGEGGAIQDVKIFAVPFIDTAGMYRASIIGGIVQTGNGTEIHEFIITADIAGGSAPIMGQEISGDIDKKAIASAADIKPLLGSIVAGNRSEIWEYIIRRIPPRIDTGTDIRAVFEDHGFSCATAPSWFQPKSIWYAGTCIHPNPIAGR